MTQNPTADISVLFYVQHLLGIGHLARASRVAQAMIEKGMRVTLVTGGLPVDGFPGPGVRHVALPPIAVSDGGFTGLVDGTGQPAEAAYLDARRDLLLQVFRDTAPDVVLTEAFPFGRRQVRFELLPLLDAIAAARPRPLLVASVRDILQARAKPGRDAETVDLVQRHYDLVLVHGDPAFARLGDTFPLADQIAAKVAYSGIVAPPAPSPPTESFDLVVSAGGGAVGAALVQAAVQAALLCPDLGSWCVIVGPNLPEAERARLAALAPSHVSLVRFRQDFPSLLTAARLSISQAGYNTVADILRAGCRALLVPYAKGGETEQTERALRLQAVGRVTVLTEAALTQTARSGHALASAIRRALAQDICENTQTLAIEGAAQSADILHEIVTKARESAF